ncbi:MAG: putative toxin-antitoxin system toxin component, PIN family [Thaumarchaeota archaeon]|nr:putative toxin-antitoxin system toxin component, PIN family [Nitrososphaerota archaeon]
MVRVVIDTNVMVSALIAKGKPRRLVSRLLSRHSVISSREMLEELSEVLSREKFGLSKAQVGRYLSIYTENSESVTLRSKVRAVAEDPDDDVVLSTAVGGNAEYIVTGDRHLLVMKEFGVTRIVTVDGALKILSSAKT